MGNSNLLIISDLHLGEDIKERPEGKLAYLRHVIMLERELESFLRHYTSHRIDGRAWRLVINGDMVDFLGICLLPQREDDLTPDEHVYGLGTKPRAARTKMERVLERHDGVFKALAAFIGAGNHVNIVVGNHDVEFTWPAVQDCFRQGIGRCWAALPASSAEGAPAREAIEAAITFHPWFYFEENVAWIEHGHQYDDYCSFDYVLNPVAPSDDEEIALNVGAAGLRYVSNQVSGGYLGDQENWTMWRYITWTYGQGRKGFWRIASGFYTMCAQLIGLWRMVVKQPEQIERHKPRHVERLQQLAAQVKLSEETLHAVDQLRRRPAVTSFAKVIGVLMLDRLALVIATALIVLTSVFALPWTWAIGVVAGAITVAGLIKKVLDRNHKDVDPAPKLKMVTEQIRKMVRAPFVVFGHTHHPVAQPLSDGGMYYNTGSWVAPEDHWLPFSFTHLLIRRGEAGPSAALCQWRDGESREFTPGR